MKKLLIWGFIIILMGLCVKLCLRRDIPETYSQNIPSAELENIVYPECNKNITINGVDYLQSQAPVGTFGGELVISTIGEGPKTFNPCNSKDNTSSSMAGLMYDGLLTTDPRTGDVIPQLAKGFSIDGNEYTIYLRHGIKWSDGKPITADDVIYTYKEIVFAGLGNTATRDMMMIGGKLPELEKIDDYTVKFTTSKPFAPFLRMLSYQIVPKHYFKPYSDKGESVFNAFLSPNTNPKEIVSNGAFRLKEYVAAQRVVFVRNPDYYKINTKDEKLPYLDKLVYLIVGDTNNEILKFEAKEIDVLGIRGSNVARYKLKEPTSDYTMYNLGADTGTMFLVINLNNRKTNGKWNVSPMKQKWFANRDFRAAIDWAIDRKAMVQNVAQGVAEPLFTAESLNSIFLNEYIKGHPSDKSVALKSLEKAGFQLKNGILYDSDGNRVEFDLYTNAGALEREALGVMIKQDLEELGMKVNFKPIEFNSLVNKLTNTHDWDMAIMGLTGSPLEPHDGKNVWQSSGPLHLFNQRPADWKADDRLEWEKELDSIFEEGALKLSFEERKPLYDRYQTIIYNQKPIIYLYSPIRITAIRNKFKNIFPTPLSGLIYNLDEIYIGK
ncbi:MAG: ABC transporter substrate-binding protein [Candidatus Gastranaerophilales bacterium]|nr:ABC transporter substrate-binding protein [Candidatus Gastranaerophilales bacterium]